MFDEQRHIKNFDTWKLFEAFYYEKDEYLSWNDWRIWEGFGNKRYAFVSGCEIYSIIYGTDKAIEKFERLEKGTLEITCWM